MRTYLRLIAFVAAALPCLVQADIQYHLRLEPDKRIFDVAVELTATDNQTTFRIPAWCPGYYQLERYDSTISGVTVTSASGTNLTYKHPDGLTWIVPTAPGAKVRLAYSVHAVDPALGFFGAMLDSKTGFINGASTFMYVDGRTKEADRLDLETPDGWDVATAMDKAGNDYVASSGYDEFIDNPIQMGSFVRKKFTVEGIPFEAVYVSRDGNASSIRCDTAIETERLRLISGPAIKMFHGAAFKHYLYILHLAVGAFDGGLEHRASTCIAVNNDSHLDLDDLAAHENFHAWNVKQIRPAVLGPFDYSQKARTSNLWWMEGVTDYYAKVLTYRSGIDDADWLLNQIRDQVTELQGSRQRTVTTLADSSRNCWENDGFGVGDLSYYTKGFLVGAILDASIRSQTDGAKSLDDVMRLLYKKYRLPQPGMPEDGILLALDEVVGKSAFDSIYHEMVDTTDELPYDVLRNIGVDVMTNSKPTLVPSYTAQEGLVNWVSQKAGGAGLRLGDRVVSNSERPWDGVSPPADGYSVTVDRGGSKVVIDLPYETETGTHADVIWDQTPGDKALRLRREWLSRPNPVMK